MALIVLKETVTYVNAPADATVTIMLPGCEVGWSFKEPVRIPWEDIEDLEKLSAMLGDYPVCAFKAIVKMLGQAYRMRDMITE